MAVNQQRKNALRRLKADLEELERSPVASVSAAPLESNMLEWHCNFMMDDVAFHLILFFPDEYPYKSPSAEFVPKTFTYRAGATQPGKKGTRVCLSIFSDFASMHREWAKAKNEGWSPGYTVQTILLNVVSFAFESGCADAKNMEIALSYTCPDCGHTGEKPYPPLENHKPEKPQAHDSTKNNISDYISKQLFKRNNVPKTREELFGYGIVVTGPYHRATFTTPCEFISGDSFFAMKKSVGYVHSILKEDLKLFLPAFINSHHGSAIKDVFEQTMKEVDEIVNQDDDRSSKKAKTTTPLNEIILRTIPNLMSSTVVSFMNGKQHASDNHLSGFFVLHRLLLWATQTYPDLQEMVDDRLKSFIENEATRHKDVCLHFGEWLMLLTVSTRYGWQDAAEAFLVESFRRHVMWYVKDDDKLGYLDTDKKYRLENTLKATHVSRKFLTFQVLFLDIALPKGMSRNDVIARYDANMGFPSEKMVAETKSIVSKVDNVKTYNDWFTVLKVKAATDDQIFDMLRDSVHFSLDSKRYKVHWAGTFAGCWPKVLEKYNADVKAGKATRLVVEFEDKDAEHTADKGKGKGKGKSSGKNGQGNGKNCPVDKDEVNDAVVTPRGKGKGKGKSPAGGEVKKEKEVVKVVEVVAKNVVNKGRGRGRGGAKVPRVHEPEAKEEESSEEEDIQVGVGRGRGRGRGGVGAKRNAEAPAPNVGAKRKRR